MYPSSGTIYLAPITDEALYQEQIAKIQFWETTNFYGIDLSPALEQAYREYFSQPVVGYFHSNCIVSSQRTLHKINFNTVTCEEIKSFNINFSFRIDKTGKNLKYMSTVYMPLTLIGRCRMVYICNYIM